MRMFLEVDIVTEWISSCVLERIVLVYRSDHGYIQLDESYLSSMGRLIQYSVVVVRRRTLGFR
jgi:hypothetical protein